MRSTKPAAAPSFPSGALPSVTNEPSCSTSTFSTPTLVSALGHAIGARPGLGLIQRGGDFPVTCYVAVKALTSSSAAAAADCRGDGHDAGRRHRWGGPRLTIVQSISEWGAQKTTTTTAYSPSGRQFIPAPGLWLHGSRRVEHGDRQVGQEQRERRQRRDVVHACLAVVLPPGQAAVEEPRGQRDPVGGLRFRQVAEVRHHELEELGL